MTLYTILLFLFAKTNHLIILAEGNNTGLYMQRFNWLMGISFVGILGLWFLVWWRRRKKNNGNK